MKPWEETWTPRHSPHASEHLPRIVNEQGNEVLFVPEHTSASYERAALDLAAAAPEMYRALKTIIDASGLTAYGTLDGGFVSNVATCTVSPAVWDSAVAALRKARGNR